MFNCGSLDSIEDTFADGYPEEIEALRKAGLLR